MKFTSKFDFNSDKIFNMLSKSDLILIKSKQEQIKFKAGDKLFYEEGIPTGMFQLITGRIKKYKTVLNNQQQIFYIYTKDDLFGYHALLSKERYQDSCEAIDDVIVKFITKSNFIMLLENIPKLKDALLENVSHEFGVLANTIAILAQKSQDIRLGLFLIVLQKRFKLKNNDSKGVDITREDLANIIGTSRESLSRSLNSLKSKGLIIVNKRLIKVIDEYKMEDYIYS